jgi:hypothetical protein
MLVGVVPLILAACGSSSAAPSSTSGSSSSKSSKASETAYTNCLKQHGVTLPNFSGGRPAGGSGSPPTGARHLRLSALEGRRLVRGVAGVILSSKRRLPRAKACARPEVSEGWADPEDREESTARHSPPTATA